ncbi:MAG: polysaccharide biosynthesis tyrosine autokinase [Bdellovibrionales bacterium]|nr:polysaccharide biosynthesis tyrosine autokinase [Bdellovibrionales bacterium]
MSEINFQEYFYRIWKRRNLAAVFITATLLLTILFTLKQTKIYRAVTTVEIGSETPDAFFVQDVMSSSYNGWWSAMRYYETQYQIIQSRDLLSRAAQKGLNQGLFPSWRLPQVTSYLQGGLSIKGDENSRIAAIYFDDSDPNRAEKAANLIAETFVDENLARKLRGIDDAVSWLNARLGEVREEKVRRQEELQKKKEEFKVVSFKDHKEVTDANLRALSESLNGLRNVRIETQAKYQKLKQLVEQSDRVEDLFGVVSSELLIKLKEDLADLKTLKSKLSQKYLDKHPEMMKINSQMNEVNGLIRQEVGNEVNRLRTAYLLAKAEEDSVASALENQKLDVIKLEQVNRSLADVELITTTNQQIFEALLRKLKEADLSALVRSNNVRVVDKALTPRVPIKPNVRKNVLLGFIVGLIGAIGLVLMLEYVDDTIKSHEDIDRYLHHSVLAVIPHYQTEAEINALPNESSDVDLAFIPMKQPTSVVSEFYRTLRTNILFLTKSRQANCILFASTGPGEGKTVTALNLAVTLAQVRKKVLLVDLDFRRPKVHRIFGQSSIKGITDVLLGELDLKNAILKSEYENLSYIPAGSIPPNPAELLSSPDIKNILNAVSQSYDYVIIDSSPIAPVTDAAIIAQYAHGVVLVVRSGSTHRKAVIFANQQLKKVNANVLGVVLNDVQIKDSSYSSYQYYRYGYSSYGENLDKPKSSTMTGNGSMDTPHETSL